MKSKILNHLLNNQGSKIRNKYINYINGKKLGNLKYSKNVINPKIYQKNFKKKFYEFKAFYIQKVIKNLLIKNHFKSITKNIYCLKNKVLLNQILKNSFQKILDRKNLYQKLKNICSKYDIKRNFTILNLFNKLNKNGFSLKLKNVFLF